MDLVVTAFVCHVDSIHAFLFEIYMIQSQLHLVHHLEMTVLYILKNFSCNFHLLHNLIQQQDVQIFRFSCFFSKAANLISTSLN